MVEGELFIHTGEPDTEPAHLKAGELVLLPHNEVHFMGSAIGGRPVPAGEVITPPEGSGLFSIRHGGGGKNTRLVCGFLGCDEVEGNPVLSTLPRMLVLGGEAGADEWIRSTFRFAADEVAAGRPGSEAVLGKLSELLFVEAVRRYTESLPDEQTGWLAGLHDPYVARALALFHADVSRGWTNESLAREVGLSRSALTERFSQLIGLPPIQYLAHWRMQVAAQSLRNTSASLAQIASSIGYESEAAFSRAFKKTFGVAPAGWRRAASAATTA